MKNTMKPVIFFLVLASSMITASAQLKGFSLGPYVETAWPAGTDDARLKQGLGAGFTADIKLPAGLGITGSAGYMHFPGRDEVTQEGVLQHPGVNVFPLRAGLKFRPLPLIYFKMEAGTARLTSGDQSGLLLSPGIGVRLAGIDLQAKYETWYLADRLGFWGIRAGINF